MKTDTSKRLALVLGWTSVMAIVLGLVIGLATGSLSDTMDTVIGIDVLTTLLLMCFPIMGMLIARRQPENMIGWLFCAIGLSFALQVLLGP